MLRRLHNSKILLRRSKSQCKKGSNVSVRGDQYVRNSVRMRKAMNIHFFRIVHAKRQTRTIVSLIGALLYALVLEWLRVSKR